MRTVRGEMNLYCSFIFIAVFANFHFGVYTYETAVRLETRMDVSDIVISCLMPKDIYKGSHKLHWLFRRNQGIITTCRPTVNRPCLPSSVISTEWTDEHKFEVIPGGASLRISQFENRTEDEEYSCGFYDGSDFSTEISFSVKSLYKIIKAGNVGESTISTPDRFTTSNYSVIQTTECINEMAINASRNSNTSTIVLAVLFAISVYIIIGIAVYIRLNTALTLNTEEKLLIPPNSATPKPFVDSPKPWNSAAPPKRVVDSPTPWKPAPTLTPQEKFPVPPTSAAPPKRVVDSPTPWKPATPNKVITSVRWNSAPTLTPQEKVPVPSTSAATPKPFVDSPKPWNSAAPPKRVVDSPTPWKPETATRKLIMSVRWNSGNPQKNGNRDSDRAKTGKQLKDIEKDEIKPSRKMGNFPEADTYFTMNGERNAKDTEADKSDIDNLSISQNYEYEQRRYTMKQQSGLINGGNIISPETPLVVHSNNFHYNEYIPLSPLIE